MSRTTRLLIAAAALAAASAAAAADLVVLCAGAARPALSELAPRWAAASGQGIRVDYLTGGELRAALAAAVPADVVVMPADDLAAGERDGRVVAGSRRDLGAVGIGVAVRAGAALPDLSTEDGVRRALLAAGRIVYMDPARGTSGRQVDEVVLPRLGIRDAVRAKTVLGQGGMIAEKVASGEADLALQQMTELLPVRGIQVAGPLPPSLQKVTIYAGGVRTGAAAPREAAAFLAFLGSSQARTVFEATGFGAP